MKDLIIQKLKEIEQQEDIRILHAVESGSRAWGFPSPDSDYDVRFIYVHRPEFYLKLEKTRDVIELPINNMLDINGWDISKTLRLLHSSNPTLFEWMNSPVVYRETEFADLIQPYLDRYFSCKSGLYHYLSMAEGNYREYLKGDIVKAKKYFYVLRPILACKWILHKGTRPPMLFRELMDSELDRTIEGLKVEIAAFPAEHRADWDPLNQLFLETLANYTALLSYGERIDVVTDMILSRAKRSLWS